MGQRISTEQRWREIILAQQASGMKAVKYCLKERVCRTSFYGWRKRLEMIPATSIPDKENDSLCVSKGFMRLKQPAGEASGMRIETPNGYRVETWTMGEEALRNVLEVLRGL